MDSTTVFLLGTSATMAIAMAVIVYLKYSLQNILVELCGTRERAHFWAAFSAVALGVMPVIFAIACRPMPGPNSPAVFELADQLKWGLIGLMSTLLVLGSMIARSILRFESRLAK